jgi:hypothetical protein
LIGKDFVRRVENHQKEMVIPVGYQLNVQLISNLALDEGFRDMKVDLIILSLLYFIFEFDLQPFLLCLPRYFKDIHVIVEFTAVASCDLAFSDRVELVVIHPNDAFQAIFREVSTDFKTFLRSNILNNIFIAVRENNVMKLVLEDVVK